MGRCGGAEQRPFDACHIAQVGHIGQLRVVPQKAGQGVAPLGQIAPQRRMVVPQVARQQREVVATDQGRDHRVSREQGAFGHGMAVGLVGRQTA